ncbi:hypothetical protein [Microcoleus phage My-WqHQDG]|nr:hypothetical protein [Microcoleus phage My-WqHQDG]
MLDYSRLKLVQGTANVNPTEDPVLGANGTANVIRINNFIQRVQEDLITMVPQGKGNLIVGGDTTEPVELQVGPNNYCLTVDPTSPSGLLWEERVDLTTAQMVGGKKTFSSDVIALQDLQVGLDLGVGGNATIVGDVSARNGHLTGTLEVGGNTLLHSTLTVINNTSLRSNLAVVGGSQLNTAVVSSTLNVGGNATLDSSLKVVGPTTMQSNLSLEGTANVTGSVIVGNDALISDSLSVAGAANIESLSVNGPSALTTTTITDLTVTGNTNLNALSITGALAVGTTLTTGGNITSGGSITTPHALTVGGVSTLGGVTSTTMTTSGTTTTGKLLALQDTSLNGVLWVGGATELRSTLLVAGSASILGDVAITGISKLGKVTTTDIAVAGDATVQGALVVDGPALIGNDLTVDGSTFVEGSSTVEQDLTVGGRAILMGNLSAVSATVGSITATTGNVTTLESDTIRSDDIEYTGTLTGNAATIFTLSTRDIITTFIEATDLTVRGTATIPGLSGINTGDEVMATPTASGTVRITSSTPDPIVYTAGDAQATFLAKEDRGVTLATLVNGKVPIAQLPPLAISDTHVVATVGDMNALTAQVGDIAVLTNPASTYILQTEPNGWVMLNTPTDAVPSVFNRVGPIQAQAGDYTATMIPITDIPIITADNVQAAIEEVVDAIGNHSNNRVNPHGVTAEQVDAIPVWEKGSGLGVATLDGNGKIPLEQLPSDIRLGSSSRKVISFTLDDLVSGVLTVGHGLQERYPSSVTVYSNLDRIIVPDDVEVVDAGTLRVYLTSYTTMSGTWNVVVAL